MSSKAGNGKGKKEKPAPSNAANSTKASTRAPVRITTVQKLHLRLLEASAIIGDRRVPSETTNGGPSMATGPGPGPSSVAEPLVEGSVSRDSSPGIDLVLPSQEPIAEPDPKPPTKKKAKRTAAQIFRELARCRSEQEEEMKRIASLEFVPITEEVVNRKAIELEEKETLDGVERRMLALLSLENAIASKEQAVQQKRKLGDKALQEKRNLRRLLAEVREREQEIADQVRAAVVALRERARSATTAAVQQKLADARELAEQTQSLVREAQKQREAERQQRAELIQEIRQLEITPLPRFKELDLTETAGHGLLDEMSIVELRERLALLNMRRTAELREKNQAILQKKKMQEEQMETTEDILVRFHEIQAHKRRQKKERSARPPAPVTSDRLQQLQRELEEKRAVRLQRAARRRAAFNPPRHLTPASAVPTCVRSAPPAGSRGRPSIDPGCQRRTQSDSCVRLGSDTPAVTATTTAIVTQSYGTVAR